MLSVESVMKDKSFSRLQLFSALVTKVVKPFRSKGAPWFWGSVEVCGYAAMVTVERTENR